MKAYKIKESIPELEEVLRARGMRLEKGKKTIQKLMNVKQGKIIRNNPEKKYHKEQPNIDSLQHYSQSQYSLDQQSEKVKPLPRALPRQREISSSMSRTEQNQQFLYMSKDSILAERARKFVSRLRKQKEYEWGKVLMHRKKEQQIKKKREKILSEQKEKEKAFFRLERYKKMMDNILYHEERITYRMRNSMSRCKPVEVRCSTEGSEDHGKYQVSRSAMFDYESDKKQSRVSELPAVISLRQRLATLSSMIDSLQQ